MAGDRIGERSNFLVTSKRAESRYSGTHACAWGGDVWEKGGLMGGQGGWSQSGWSEGLVRGVDQRGWLEGLATKGLIRGVG